MSPMDTVMQVFYHAPDGAQVFYHAPDGAAECCIATHDGRCCCTCGYHQRDLSRPDVPGVDRSWACVHPELGLHSGMRAHGYCVLWREPLEVMHVERRQLLQLHLADGGLLGATRAA